MTLIEIIKTSLLGFSAIFVLSWIFFYLYLKMKKSNNQNLEDKNSFSSSTIKIAQRPMVQPSPVYVQPVVYQSVRKLNQPLAETNRVRFHKEKVHHIPVNKPEKFEVFNKRQYGFYYNS